MKFEYYDYTISEHYAPAIINDDYSGLDDGEHAALTNWLEDNEQRASHWDIEDENRHFARCEVSGLMSDCLTIRQYFRR